MPFELENTRKELDGNLDWLYVTEYRKKEDQVTEGLFKWFFLSSAEVQKVFLSKICGVSRRRAIWKKLNLQRRGKTGTPDAVLHLGDGSQILFELKIKQKAVSRSQLRRHLRDAGFRKGASRALSSPRLILITPDYREPKKLSGLSNDYRKFIEWVPWTEIVVGFLDKLRVQKSSDRLLRDGLKEFLKDELQDYILLET